MQEKQAKRKETLFKKKRYLHDPLLKSAHFNAAGHDAAELITITCSGFTNLYKYI